MMRNIYLSTVILLILLIVLQSSSAIVNLNKYDNITLVTGNELDTNGITIITSNLIATRISQL